MKSGNNEPVDKYNEILGFSDLPVEDARISSCPELLHTA